MKSSEEFTPHIILLYQEQCTQKGNPMIPIIRQTESEIVGRNSYDETIRVVADSGKYAIYHSDIGPESCRLVNLPGIFLIVNKRGKPQVIDQEEMLFILWAIDQLGGGPAQSGEGR
jgi:hypothetical protein